MSLRIRKGDKVMVISGVVDNDPEKGRHMKGVVGTVLSVQPKKGTAIVEGANLIVKHQKARNQNEQGGRIRREAPIPLSKLMLVDAKGRAARFKVRKNDKGEKERVLKLKGEKDVIV
ncbi:MAG: 50S ribosomal protein L24 [Candidatus Sumerlaeia bacterium]